MDSVIDSTRQLCVSALKGLKKLINSELSGPQGASPEFAGVFATNTSRYMQIQVHTCKYMQIQIYTSKYNYIHANTSTYKQIQVYTCKYKYIQANTNDRQQYWYVFGCIRLYLYVLYLFLYVFVCIINNIDFFESDAMGTTRVGTGGNLNAGKCILTVFGKRSTAAGGPTYRVSALTCFFQLGLSCDTLALPPVSQSRWVHAP